MFQTALKSFLRASACLAAVGLTHSASLAGEFNMSWTSLDWPTDSTGPVTFTITDEYGYEIQLRIGITRIGGTALTGFPDDLTVSGSNEFGTIESLWTVWDAGFGNGSIGDSTNTINIEILNGGVPLSVDQLVFEVSDIDAVDNNATSDRCDFVTLTGNAGSPSLSYKANDLSLRSVRIGPITGSGATGTIGSNQAQCIYNIGATTSPSSNGDDNGTIIADYPAGTHSVSIAYDESIANVLGLTNVDPAARGIGVFAGSIATVNAEISLEKTSTLSSFAAVGDVIPYTYTITNDGPLPINASQNIVIQDDKIGEFTCGNISSAIPVGGTHQCTANYTVTATDVTAGEVTNIAVAGVGTGSQSFSTRLQSNVDQVTVTASTPGKLTCPAGMSAISASGNADGVIVSALNSAQALGTPEFTGTIANDGNSARLINSSPTLVLDLSDTVPGNAILPLTIARNNTGGNYTISTSLDNFTFTTVGTFSGGTLDQLQLYNVTVPGNGARYVRFQRNSGSLWVAGIAYSDICQTSASLTGSKSVNVWDPQGIGLYAVPGNDVIYSITGSNSGEGSTDVDSVVLIDTMPAEVSFFNGDIDDGGPETDPVTFSQSTGAGLTFSYATDVGYSNATTRPANFNECNYLPTSGYDETVTFICFNPKGALTAGDPDPNFTVSFRARIR